VDGCKPWIKLHQLILFGHYFLDMEQKKRPARQPGSTSIRLALPCPGAGSFARGLLPGRLF
jgi:hypothetical protein